MTSVRNSIVAAFLYFFNGLAHASIHWNWQIDNPSQIVNSDEIIQFNATIFNLPDSTENILPPIQSTNYSVWVGQNFSLLSAQGDFTSDRYTFDDGPLGDNSFSSQFDHISIAPGQSYSFVLYTLIPKQGGVKPGLYSAPFNSLYLQGYNTTQGFLEGGAVSATVVPIPIPLLLLFSGLLSIFGFTRRRPNI